MTQAYQPQQQAEGKIRTAVERLLDEFPFHARILERFQTASRPDVGTMGVTVAGNDLCLLYNPNFIVDTPWNELSGVLLHETHHVLFEHVLADPDDFPDGWARTVAEEVTANEFIRHPLPGQPIRLELFPDLPPMESTHQRYLRLQRQQARMPIAAPRVHAGGGDMGRQTAQQAGAGTHNQQPAGSAADKDCCMGGCTVDDHTLWQQARQDPRSAKAAIRNLAREAALEVGMDQVPPQFRDAVGSPLAGNAPGTDQYDFEGHRHGQLDWRRLLRWYAAQLSQVRPVFNRPSRRFPRLVGIVPGKRRQFEPPKIMAVIDTSASITPELLRQIDERLIHLWLARPDIRFVPPGLRPETHVMLDEVAKAGSLARLDDLLLMGRAKGVSVTVAAQDVEAMRQEYGEKIADSLLAQCGNTAVFALESPETRDYCASLFGTYEVRERPRTFKATHMKAALTMDPKDLYHPGDLREHKTLLSSQFSQLPRPADTGQIVGYFITGGLGAHWAAYPFPHLLLPPANVPVLLPRDAADQEFPERLSPADRKRLGIPEAKPEPSAASTPPPSKPQTAPAAASGNSLRFIKRIRSK